MKTTHAMLVCLLAGGIAAGDLAAAAAPLGTGFTYQGKIESNGLPINGTLHLRFSLWDAATGGGQLGSSQILVDVPVANGLFVVLLNAGGQFGTSAFNGDARWLEIEVCTSGDCTSTTVLSPRQPLSPAPYALKVPGIDSHSLDAADGSPADVVYVNNAGNVGIGTQSPAKKLTVDGDVEIGTGHGDYHHLRIGGGNSSGFLYGSFVHFADGIHLGYNYYADAAGFNRVIHPDGGTSRITTGYGFVAIATQGASAGEPVNRLMVESNGNVRLGANTALYAPGGVENLRIVRGVVAENGSIIVGTGFSVTREAVGKYLVTFTTPFAGPPAVTLGEEYVSGSDARTNGVTSSWARIWTKADSNHTFYDTTFHFIAAGPR